MTKSSLLLAVVVVVALVAPRSPAADLVLLPGTLRNVSASCGTASRVSVQFMGDSFSPEVRLDAGATARVSLARGSYAVTVTRPDGTVVEETRAYVLAKDFRLAFGCQMPVAWGLPPRGDVRVKLANTSGDCGQARAVDFFVDGHPAGHVAAGATVEASVPAADAIVEVTAGGHRLLLFHLPVVRAGRTLFFGCTDPDATSEGADGVEVAFENTTDACDGAGQRRNLTLSVDGLPRLGLAPGQRGVAVVARGRHDVAVTVGWTRERVVSGSKDVTAPFMVRYGCGR